MKILLLSFLWIACLSASFAIVNLLKIGPVLYTFSLERGWGLHNGDFLALIPPLFALVFTMVLARRK